MHTEAMKVTDRAPSIMPRYVDTIMLLERLHRRMQELVKDALDRAGVEEINAVQALMLYNIADQELSVSELRARDYYTGSNSSYNVKKLVEAGYITYAKSRVDRRCARISLGERGKEIHALVASAYERHARTLDCIGGLEAEDLSAINHSLGKLDRFWTDQILYKL